MPDKADLMEIEERIVAVDAELEKRRWNLTIFRTGVTELKWFFRIITLLVILLWPLRVYLVGSVPESELRVGEVLYVYVIIIGWVLSGWGSLGSIRAHKNTNLRLAFKIYLLAFGLYLILFTGMMLELGRHGFPT